MSALHFRRLAAMYRHAPVNALEMFGGRVRTCAGEAETRTPVKRELCHTAGGLHGSVYFKALDDAAFFAAATTNEEHFVVTTSFTTYLTRPVIPGKSALLIGRGKVVSASKSLILVEATVRTEAGVEVGRGSGTFMPNPSFALGALPGYATDRFLEEDAELGAAAPWASHVALPEPSA